MSCRSYREELSRCLDGRLPSHARARVMGHAAKCRGCARFWEELKAAQELVLSLPQVKAGSRFRDDVWQRIQSGEGAPDTIAQEPVPVATKVRYGLLGAAAAALFLLVLHYGDGRSTEPEIGSPPDIGPIAKEPNAEPVPTLRFPSATVANLTPANLAAQTAEQVSQAARNLRNRSKNLPNLKAFPPEVLQDVRREIETMQQGVFMLNQLREGFGIELRDPDARDCLTRVLATLELQPNLERREDVVRTLHSLSGCSLERLQDKLLFTHGSMQPAHEKIMELVRRQPPGFVRIVPVPMGSWGEVRFEFWMVPAEPNQPQKQPQKARSRKLRERSPR
jgi:anti-sigma factor RsiW